MPSELDWSHLKTLERRVKTLPLGLQNHIYRVGDIAEGLATVHNLDPTRARIGMFAHDIARSMPDHRLLQLARAFDLKVAPIEDRIPVLLHGPVGAELLKREEGIDDTELYEAVCWHTTGNASMDSFAKLVFLADKLDPEKCKRYPYRQHLMELAKVDLDHAMVEFLTRELIALATGGFLIHPGMLATRNFLIQSNT